MKQLSIRTEVASPTGPSGVGSSLPEGCDIAVLGKIEMHSGRLDGFNLQVILSHKAHLLISQEARQKGKMQEEILAYHLGLSLNY